jgi:2-aminoethylphosphonate-pyruvate transaminase
MNQRNHLPLLLTPGPLTTSDATRRAMGRDWGSRDTDFIELTARVRQRLAALAGGKHGDYVAVPLQGSGTFIVEATLGTMMPRDGKMLVLINGAYGKRMAAMLDVMGRAYATVICAEDEPMTGDLVAAALQADSAITHVAAVHCETTSGILNPIDEIAQATARHGRSLLIDAMSAFGALELDAGKVPFSALMASSNKCLEGVPGIGFSIVRKADLATTAGQSHSLSLDLYGQWQGFEGNGQWRFTPPTHVLAALDAALEQHQTEGGVAGRFARYSRNCRTLVDGMRELGFQTLLPDELQAPIIVTFHAPDDPAYQFARFYDLLHDRGFAIYPGKLTAAETFRIGCIGALDDTDMTNAVTAVKDTLAEMGVATCRPAAA